MTLGVKKRQLLGERSRLLSSGSWVAEQAAGDLLGPVVVEEGGRRVVHEVLGFGRPCGLGVDSLGDPAAAEPPDGVSHGDFAGEA
jgi:hypothetical protein